MTETASDFIARKSAEWERERSRGKLIRMKDVNREAIHVYRRDAWTFLVQDTYAEAVNVLERLTHLETIGVPAVPMKLPAAEYRLGYFIKAPCWITLIMRTVYQGEYCAHELCASNGEIGDFGSITGVRPQRHVRADELACYVGRGRRPERASTACSIPATSRSTSSRYNRPATI